MKRLFAIIFLIAVLLVTVILGLNVNSSDEKFLRIHIVSNSLEINDEKAKKEIVEEMQNFLSPSLSFSCEEFLVYLKQNLKNICGIANEILAQNNLDYKSSAELSCRFFEKEILKGKTLNEGNYHLLKITLGQGNGENESFFWESCNNTALYESRIF